MPEDDLERAVDARIDAYRPDTIPPFAALTARKRARDRRRHSRAAALSALSVVGVVGVVFAGPSLTGGGDRLTGPPVAGPAATPTVTVDDRTTRYGLSYVDSGAYDIGRDEPLMEACLALPGTSEVSVQESWPPGYSVLLTGTEQAKAFERCAVDLDNVTVRNLDATPSGIRWTGVQVCQTQPAGPCRDLDAATASRLYDALALDNRRQVDPNGAVCAAASVTYTLLFSNPGADVKEITVPGASCKPVTVGISDYEVDAVPRELVRQAYAAAVTAARDGAIPCLPETPTEPGYVGLTEQQALDLATRQGLTVRVVGRDGTCPLITYEMDPDRVNLDLVSGRVARAIRS